MARSKKVSRTKTKRDEKPKLVEGHTCAVCKATETTEWRSCLDPYYRQFGLWVCNPCGIFYREHGHRYRTPEELARLRSRKSPTVPPPTLPTAIPSARSPTPPPDPKVSIVIVEDVELQVAQALLDLQGNPKPSKVSTSWSPIEKKFELLQFRDYRPAWAFGPHERPRPARQRKITSAVAPAGPRPLPPSARLPLASSPSHIRSRCPGLEVTVQEPDVDSAPLVEPLLSYNTSCSSLEDELVTPTGVSFILRNRGIAKASRGSKDN